MQAVFFDASGVLYHRRDGRAILRAALRRQDRRPPWARARGAVTLFDGVPETLAALRARGFKIGVITDTSVSTAEKLRWLRDAGLDLPWHAFANSREVGARKPDPAIYRFALAQAGVAPATSLFVGHAAHELAGARALGMATVAFNPDPGARADYRIARFADLLALPALAAPAPLPDRIAPRGWW